MTVQLKKGLQVTTLLLATAILGAAQVGMGMPGTAYSIPSNGNQSVQTRSTPPVGAVNYVEGQVSLNGHPLSPQSVGSAVLNINGVLTTGSGFAEILLAPGSFLRLGHDSEVRMTAAGLVNTHIKLVHGCAMIEVAEFVKGRSLGVEVNGVNTQIVKIGLYGFDTAQMAVRVLEGKAKVMEGDRLITLTKDDQVLLTSSTPAKRVDFNRKAAQEDPLYIWSKARSQNESAANINEARYIASNGGWYGAGWYWDPYWASYAFLPGYGFIGSPFGWGFYSPLYAFGGYGLYGRPYYRGGFVATRSVGVARGFAGGRR